MGSGRAAGSSSGMPRADDHLPRATPWGRAPAVRRAALAISLSSLALLGACGAERVDDEDAAVGEIGDDLDRGELEVGGDDPTLTDDTVDAGDETDELTAELEVTVGTAEEPFVGGQALLECDPDGSAGVLWLEGAAADEACEALQDPTVVAALGAPDADEACAEVDGGPEVATIVGTVEGLQVDAVLDRSDACAIERWDLLEPLLPDL